MKYSIKYQQRAVKEYESAVKWYQERSELAASNFEIAVTEKIELLKVNPASYRKTYKNFHEISLSKYPFCIIYLIDESRRFVVISSIFHHKRNPKLKYRQL